MTELLAKYYAEIDALCIIVLGLLAVRTLMSNIVRRQKVYFEIVLVCHIVFSASDLVWIFNNDFLHLMNVFPENGVSVSYVLNGMNVIFSAITGLAWMVFSLAMQGSYILRSWKKTAIILLPALILIILTATTQKTQFMFHVSETGEFTRGPGYMIQLLISYGYILTSTLMSIRRAVHAIVLQERRLSRTIAHFIIAPLCFGAAQLFLPDMQVLFIGTVVALLSVYISLQEMQIVTDQLTGLNNRSLLDQKIQMAIQLQSRKEDLYLMMIDANHFKKINDEYGHLVGDKVLMLIADALRRNCGAMDYLCRWGGDEFVLLHKAPRGEGCEKLVQEINAAIAASDAPCNVSVSIGVCQYTPEIGGANEFMKAADAEMYRVKAAKGHPDLNR